MENKLVERVYLGFFILLPLVFYTKIVDTVLLPRQLFLTFFLLVLALVLILKKIQLPFAFKNLLFLTVFCFLSLNLISFSQAGISSESHAVFSKLAVLFGFFTITTLLFYNNIIRVEKLVIAVIFFCLISFSFSFYEIIEKSLKGQHLLRQVDTITGNSANKNLLSSILFLCLPFCCIGLKVNKSIRILSFFSIASILFILLTIRTRAVLIACFLFFLLLICYKVKQRFAIKKRYFLASGLVFIILFFVTYKVYLESKIANLHYSSTNIVQQYFYRLFASETFKTRTLFWQNSLDMFKDHFLLGVGVGNWQIHFPKYGLNNFTNTEIINGVNTLQRPHNDFIWILCETGILGLLSYLAIFAVIFYQLVFLIKNSATSQDKWKYLIIFSSLIGYMLISFFDFPYERIEHQVILMLLFAIVASSYYKANLNTDRARNYKPFLFLLLIPIGYSFLVSFNRLNGETHWIKMYQAKINQNWTETIYEAEQSENYFYKLDNTSMPLQWYKGIGYFNENQLEESEACFYKAYQLNPYNIQVINNLASACQANGKIDQAEAFYTEALKISIHFDEAKLNLAALYFNKKDYPKAYATINEVATDSKNPKYKTYLVPILNQKINAFLKTNTNKGVVNNLVKNVNTKEKLLQLFFDAKKNRTDFETYLSRVKF